MPTALVGIDVGQTRTKAVVFDREGVVLGAAIDFTEPDHPRPLWAERNLDSMWARTTDVIRRAVEAAGTVADVVGVGVSGHSDGLYVVDEAGTPLRPAILATDARAARYASELSAGARGDRLLQLTGQVPMAAAPAPVLRWLRDHEPEVMRRARWLLASTDWLRLMLTGVVATDRTMAATGFLDMDTRDWSAEALRACDLGDVLARLPPVTVSDAIVGTVTPAAARLTGLQPGTPVVAGAHDVDAGALGMGCTSRSTTVLLGTYAINQVLDPTAVLDPRWQVRPFLDTEQWLHMSTSPAGAGCLDWAAARIGPHDTSGGPDSAAAVAEAATIAATMAQPYFLPFIHGGPPLTPTGGGWVGLRSEHGRASMLRAVMEGVAFSHRAHLEALGSKLSVPAPIRVGGGGARSHVWTQMLCDTWGVPVEVTASEEVGTLGAALLAGIGVGVYRDAEEAVSATVRVAREHQPLPTQHDLLSARYERYTEAVEGLGRVDLGPFENTAHPSGRLTPTRDA
jgi:L-xylulokinase